MDGETRRAIIATIIASALSTGVVALVVMITN